MLLVLVFQVGRLPHERERLVIAVIRPRGPARRAQAHHLDLGCPVIVFRGAQRVALFDDLVDFGLGRVGIADARRAEGARLMGECLGERECAFQRLQLCRLPPGAALNRQTRWHRCQRVGADEPRRRRVDAHRFLVRLACLAVPGELQIGVDDVVHRMQRVIAFVALERHVSRTAVGRRRVLPGADAGEDMRGHVQRMRRGRRDGRVASCRRQTLLCDRRRVVGVDQVMRDARMIRIF